MKIETITLGAGCFWCSEAAYQMIRGVTEVTSGYAGGTWPDPTYLRVTTGTTGHAEVAQIEFNPEVVTLKDILDVFWIIHDPTTLNRQGNDVGTQYRSIILYSDESQKPVIEASLAAAQEVWHNEVVTEVKPLDTFYPAEAEHADYFKKNPSQAYCQIIINPKLKKLREKYATLIDE